MSDLTENINARLKASSASAKLIKALEKKYTILTSTGEVEKVAQKYMIDQFEKTGKMPRQPEVMKMVLKYFDDEEIRPKRGIREEEMKGEDPCWDDYEMVGHKEKDGRKVPNCVPKNESSDHGWDPELLKHARKFDRDQVNMGLKVEKEHDVEGLDVVKDKNDLLKIALAHLEEDPEYYTKLADMEEEFEETYAPSEYPQMRNPYLNKDSHGTRPGPDHVPLGRKRPRLKENAFGRNTERVMRAAGLLNESMSRHCMIYKDKKGDWWLELANREYGDQNDATTYGPFDSEDQADDYIRNFSNPGSVYIDRSGKRPVPKKSPNGRPIVSPSRRSW